MTRRILAFLLLSAGLSPAAHGLGTGFTYQGRLSDAGVPAGGAYDLEFRLFDAASGGTQVGSTFAQQDVEVTGGLFTVQLDFGASVFDGNDRWLEIGVRPGLSSGAFTVLSPRQQLSAAPNALYSALAGNALALGGVAASGYMLAGSILAVSQGGTGATTATGARVNLAAAKSGANSDITSLSGLTTPLNVAQGGTGAADPAAALASLGAQARVGGVCPPGSGVRTVNPDGTVVCEATEAVRGFTRSSLGTADSLAEQTSIAIGSDGLPLISFYSAGLQVAHCHDVTCTTATVSTVDATLAGAHSSIAIGSDGLGLISYHDPMLNDLKVAHCNDVACTTATTAVVDAASIAGYTSLAIGSDGLGLISYFQSDAVFGDNNLRIAHCSNVACSAATITTLDAAAPGRTSITIGNDGLGLVSYQGRLGFADYDLRVAHCDDALCSSATVATIATPTSGGSGFPYSSIAVGADGLGLVSYYDQETQDLKAAHCSDAVCSSATVGSLDTGGSVGKFAALAIGADGLGLVAYYDETNGNLKAAHCESTLCATASSTVVDGAADDVGMLTSIAIGVDDLPLIAYYDWVNASLKVAHCSNAACVPFVNHRPTPTARVAWASLAGMPAAFADGMDNVGSVAGFTRTDAGPAPESFFDVLGLAAAIGPDGTALIPYATDFGPDSFHVAHCRDTACTSFTTASPPSVSSASPKISVAIGSDGLGLIAGLGPIRHCQDALCTSVTGGGGFVGDWPSIAIGTDGFGLISAGVSAGPFPKVKALGVFHCEDTACNWTTQSIIDTAANDVGSESAIAIGADGLGIVAYYEASTDQLKAAHCDDVACTSATKTTIDVSGGRYPAIAIGADGLALISYTEGSGRLKAAHCNDVACTSATTAVLDLAPNLSATSIAIGADGLGVISYYDDGNDALKVAHCSNRACSLGTTTIVDDHDFGPSQPQTSIVIGTDGQPLIAYSAPRPGFGNQTLKVVHCSNPQCLPYVNRPATPIVGVTAVTAGTGLSGGSVTSSGTLSVNFAGTGIATTVARSDHGHTLGGDVTGALTAATVARIRGVNVSTTAPTANQALRYNAGATQWEPAAVVTSVASGSGLTGGPITSTGTLSVNFGGSGAATTVSRSDHNHFGQAWSGSSQTALDLSGSAGGGAWFNLGNTSVGGKSYNLISTGSANGEGAGKLLFRSNNDSRVVLTLEGTGEVGIGTTSPASPLDLGIGTYRVQFRDEGATPGLNLGGAGGNVGILRVRRKLEIFPNDAATAAGALDIRNTSGNPTISFDGGTGNASFSGTVSKGGGSFKIDHPLDPTNKYLYHSFVESPDMKNIYDGVVTTDASGFAVVELPAWFEALNRDFRYQLTVLGSGAWARARVHDEIACGRFRIQTDLPDIKVSWQVTGIRKDAFAEKHRIPVEQEKPAGERGSLLYPEAYDKPAEAKAGRR